MKKKEKWNVEAALGKEKNVLEEAGQFFSCLSHAEPTRDLALRLILPTFFVS